MALQNRSVTRQVLYLLFAFAGLIVVSLILAGQLS